jgi:predicted RecA/RadA family phage recombinase
MNNYKRPGHTMTYAHSAAVTSGQALVIGALLVVAAGSYAADESGEYAIDGVFELPKTTGTAMNAGQVVNFDTTENKLIGTEPGFALMTCAVVMEDAASAATTVEVRLLPGRGVVGGSGS